MDLKKIMDEWAKNLADKAKVKDTPLQESTDAFKAVTAYYAAQQKGRKKSGDPEPDDGGFTFESEAPNGGRNQKVRAHRDS